MFPTWSEGKGNGCLTLTRPIPSPLNLAPPLHRYREFDALDLDLRDAYPDRREALPRLPPKVKEQTCSLVGKNTNASFTNRAKEQCVVI